MAWPTFCFFREAALRPRSAPRAPARPNGCYQAPAPRPRPGPRTVLLAGPLGYDPHGGAEGRRSDRGRSASRKTPRRVPTMSTSRATSGCAGVLLSLGLCGAAAGAEEADLILHHGKVVTVDRDFSIRQALAVKGDRLLRVGTDEEVLKTRGPEHRGGRPRRQDGPAGPDRLAHAPDRRVHDRVRPPDPRDGDDPGRAGLHPVAGRGAGRRASGSSSARCSSPGSRSSATRPGRSWTEAAPKNPVLFATGPDASLNSLALKLSGIDKDFKARRGRARSRRTRRPASRPASSATSRGT